MLNNRHCLVIAFRRPDETKFLLDRLSKISNLSVTVYVDNSRDFLIQRLRQEVLEVVDGTAANVIDIISPSEPMGCRRSVETAITEFLGKHGQGLVLEDDLVPSDDFFEFAFWALREFRGTNAMMISGRNEFSTLGARKRGYEITTGGTWGWGTWVESWEKYNSDIGIPSVEELSDLSMWLKSHDRLTWSFICAGVRLVESGKIDTWDFHWAMSRLQNGGVSINAPTNMVENVGHTKQSTHNTFRRKDPYKIADANYTTKDVVGNGAQGLLWPSKEYLLRPKSKFDVLAKSAAIIRSLMLGSTKN